jgi:phosphoribosyl 1,2-cyclic phosphodiesterase
MRVRFWGVRGALASTDAASQGIGGNTPCIEVRDAHETLVILDAGIGLYWLGKSLLSGPHGRGKGETTILLSHTHWDHIQGFPFFVPAYIPGNQIAVYGGVASRIEDILEGQLNPVYSPIVSLANMGARTRFGRIEDHAALPVGGLTVRHAILGNGAHDCVGYRLEEQGRSLVYMAEIEHPAGRLAPQALALAKDADVLVHEAYYTNEELAGAVGLAGPTSPRASGHSSHAQAVDLALAAGAKRLLFFYHHPDHDDRTIEAAVARERARVREKGASLDIDAAREGVEVRI